MENLDSVNKIEIKTLTINAKKITKSIFNQLGDYECLNAQLEFKGDKMLGFVNVGDKRSLLWVSKGLLRKTSLEPYYKVLFASSATFIENVRWFLNLTNIEFFESSGHSSRLSDLDDYSVFDEKVGKLRAFLNTIESDMQIFL